jgi:hypothetical protein
MPFTVAYNLHRRSAASASACRAESPISGHDRPFASDQV